MLEVLYLASSPSLKLGLEKQESLISSHKNNFLNNKEKKVGKMGEPLSPKNFFTEFYIINPSAPELDSNDHDRALLYSVALGILTVGLVHLGCAIVRWCITQGSDKPEDKKASKVAVDSGIKPQTTPTQTTTQTQTTTPLPPKAAKAKGQDKSQEMIDNFVSLCEDLEKGTKVGGLKNALVNALQASKDPVKKEQLKTFLETYMNLGPKGLEDKTYQELSDLMPKSAVAFKALCLGVRDILASEKKAKINDEDTKKFLALCEEIENDPKSRREKEIIKPTSLPKMLLQKGPKKQKIKELLTRLSTQEHYMLGGKQVELVQFDKELSQTLNKCLDTDYKSEQAAQTQVMAHLLAARPGFLNYICLEMKKIINS